MWDDQSPSSWRISSAKSVSRAWIPCVGQRCVQLDLVGRERLHLHDLVGADDGRRRRRRPRSPRRRRPPSGHARPAASTASANCTRYCSRLPSTSSLIAAPRGTKLLPVGKLGDHALALRLDRVGGRAEIRPQLHVRELLAAPRSGKLGHRLHAPLRDARISARWIVRTSGATTPQPAADLQQARAVDRRAELGADLLESRHTCRRPSRSTSRRFSPRTFRRSRSTRWRAARSTSSSPSTLRQQAERRVADARDPQRMTGRVVRNAMRERGADVVEAAMPHEVLGQLEEPRAEILQLHGQAFVASLPRDLGMQLPYGANAPRRTARRRTRNRRTRPRDGARAQAASRG